MKPGNITSFRFKRTRLAPTPSGYLHLGNVFSFAITAALSRQTGASIFLRIDDLDHERVQRTYLQDVFDTLHFLGIPWDEGPRDVNDFLQHYSQLQREELYNYRLQQLRSQHLLFACDCSRKQLTGSEGYPGYCRNKRLSLDEPDKAWRIFTDSSMPIVFRELFTSHVSASLPEAMTDFIVRRRDSKAAYQLSSLADDAHYEIDLVVRGQDLLDSTIAQSYLSSLLPDHPLQHACFFHHPLLLTEAGEKLSKTAGSVSVQYLRAAGHRPDFIYTQISKRINPSFEAGTWQELANCFFASLKV